MSLSTTWTQNDAVAFNTGVLSDISACVSQVEQNLMRGSLSSSSVPTDSQVQDWLIIGKQELCSKHGFSWKRRYVYADTVAGTWRYAMPADYAGGVIVIRNLTTDEVLDFYPNAEFDIFVDPAGQDQAEPTECTIKDRELWLSAPADGVYRLEMEYPRTGADDTATDISYLPELFRYRICDYATYRAFIMLQQWTAAQAYKSEWQQGVTEDQASDNKKKWAQMGYTTVNFFYKKSSS